MIIERAGDGAQLGSVESTHAGNAIDARLDGVADRIEPLLGVGTESARLPVHDTQQYTFISLSDVA